MEQETKVITNPELTKLLAKWTGSDCEDCEEAGREQNFTVTSKYEDDGVGVYPIIYCYNCKKETESGDADFHAHYTIQSDEFGSVIDYKE